MTPEQIIFAEYDQGYFNYEMLVEKLHTLELTREAC